MKKLTLILILLSLGGFSAIATGECETCVQGAPGCPDQLPNDNMPAKLGE